MKYTSIVSVCEQDAQRYFRRALWLVIRKVLKYVIGPCFGQFTLSLIRTSLNETNPLRRAG